MEALNKLLKVKVDDSSILATFVEYLQIASVQPGVDYTPIVQFLKEQSIKFGLKFSQHELVTGNPIVVLTLEGRDPSLPSVAFNSHTDVVPVEPQYWKHPKTGAPLNPFGAEIIDGKVYARGAQDMKLVGIQTLFGLARSIQQTKSLPLRTVHLIWLPDEEVGGKKGAEPFVTSDAFGNLNIGIWFDEGLASGASNSSVPVYYGERSPVWVHFKVPGAVGHGSQFLPNTAGAKLPGLLRDLVAFRDLNERRLQRDPSLHLGAVTTINISGLSGGSLHQPNVVPACFTVQVDCRTPPHEYDSTVAFFESIAAKHGAHVEWYQRDPKVPNSELSGGLHDAFIGALNAANVRWHYEIFPAATDARYARRAGVQAFGMSYMPNCPVLLHDHNECIDVQLFLEGAHVFTQVVLAVTNCAKD